MLYRKTSLHKNKGNLKSSSRLKNSTSLRSCYFSSLRQSSSLKQAALTRLKAKDCSKTFTSHAFKKRRIQNKAVIDACRRPTCEVCGRPAGGEPHHIITRGAGGPDIPENLIQLCGICHTHAHTGELSREKILWTIASRFRTTPSAILEIINKHRTK